MREELADLEHVQWAHWTKYMLSNMTSENVSRWERQCETAYQNLTEREKESDRQWADKVLEVLAAYTLNDFPTSMIVLEIAQRPDCQEALERVMKTVREGGDAL